MTRILPPVNTTGLVFTIVGGLAGVAALMWAAATYRQGRRRSVRISRTKTLLVRHGSGASNIEVRLREHDITVATPYSVTLKLTAQRPNDVAVEAFGGRPLRIEFGTSVVSLIEIGGHPDATKIAADWRDEFAVDRVIELPFVDFIELPPALLSVSEPWTITVLCDGDPDPQVTVKLANVDFITTAGAQRRLRRFRRVAYAVFLVGIFAGTVTGLATDVFTGSAVVGYTALIAACIPMLAVVRFGYLEEF